MQHHVHAHKIQSIYNHTQSYKLVYSIRKTFRQLWSSTFWFSDLNMWARIEPFCAWFMVNSSTTVNHKTGPYLSFYVTNPIPDHIECPNSKASSFPINRGKMTEQIKDRTRQLHCFKKNEEEEVQRSSPALPSLQHHWPPSFSCGGPSWQI